MRRWVRELEVTRKQVTYGGETAVSIDFLSLNSALTDSNDVEEIDQALRHYQGDLLSLSQTDQIGRIRKAWQEAIPRLLIFDNCEEEALLSEWVPVTGGCRVLLTSRRANWSRALQVCERPLPLLDLSESVALLNQLVPNLNPEEASDIATELGRLPLALHLAGSFLERYPQITAKDTFANNF
ncbi:hypothetical protein MNBD_CHLOROFLEXI01-3805 [hydrothermal vent metagenome]|uniref:NB-ARC domain-containing protein n=1 Tax=hydrothermal vent metagenome TaxID=652676 RepID=A0A3B0UZU3_9ZZZZ